MSYPLFRRDLTDNSTPWMISRRWAGGCLLMVVILAGLLVSRSQRGGGAISPTPTWPIPSPTWPILPPTGQIAFVSGLSRHSFITPELYVINADGGGLRQLGGFDYLMQNIGQPTWSPDGMWLAYIFSDGRHYSEVHLVNYDATKYTRLTNYTHSGYLTWSPDNTYIAYGE